MAITKLFQPVKGKSKSMELLGGQTCDYYFSVLFTKHTHCNLYLLNAQLSDGSWHQLITVPVADTDGEITVKIGSFAPGTALNFMVGIQAVSEIPSVALFIVNKPSSSVIKVAPAKEKKKLSTGELWNLPINAYPLQP